MNQGPELFPIILGLIFISLAVLALVGLFRLMAMPASKNSDGSTAGSDAGQMGDLKTVKGFLIRESVFLLLWPISPLILLEIFAGRGDSQGFGAVPFLILIFIGTPILFIYVLYYGVSIPPQNRRQKLIVYGSQILNIGLIILYLKLVLIH